MHAKLNCTYIKFFISLCLLPMGIIANDGYYCPGWVLLPMGSIANGYYCPSQEGVGLSIIDGQNDPYLRQPIACSTKLSLARNDMDDLNI